MIKVVFSFLLGILLFSTPIWAQGIGLGLGIADIRSLGVGPPAVPSILLIDTGSALLSNTGVKFLIHN